MTKRASKASVVVPQREETKDTVIRLMNDVNVIRFSIEVNRITNITRVVVVRIDGSIETTVFLPSDLAEAIHTMEIEAVVPILLRRGMTQQEVSYRLGISQSLVSKIHRST
jgi:hypothetical protein